MTKFINTAKPYNPPEDEIKRRPGVYHYDVPSPYLLAWSTLLQSVLSQAGNYMLTGKFHDQHTGIYKAEGGCNLTSFGGLVLGPHGCYFDHNDKTTKKHAAKLAMLITDIVLHWDPMDPINSMLTTAADRVRCSVDELKKPLEKHWGGPFNGNALSYFFDWNARPTLDRKYLRWCHINISGRSAKEVDQEFKDEDLADELHGRLLKAYKERNGDFGQKFRPSSVRAKRTAEGIKFNVNCMGKCNMDGWKTMGEITAFLLSDEKFHE